MSKRKLNIELLTKVRDRIRDIPESYYQGAYVFPSSESPCGARACVAGETVICNAPSVAEGVKDLMAIYQQWNSDDDAPNPGNVAAAMLGLSSDEADTLFYGEPAESESGWPEPFRAEWATARSASTRSAVAVRYLTHIIETGRVLD